MNKKLLFTKNTKTVYSLFIFCLSMTIGWSQTNLVLNGTGDDFQTVTSDNADAWDMTPSSTVKLDADGGTESDSPYKALWNNSALGTYLEDTYNSGSGVDEQPGASSDGTYDGDTKTKGLKLYGDGDPVVSESTRRLYQKIIVEAGSEYTFSIESRSEAVNIPSEVFMLNEEITTEAGLENGASDSRVDAYLKITNDFNSSKGGEDNNTFTTSTFDFTASTTTIVIYVRALLANNNKTTEVFFDNISLIKKVTASVSEVFASNFAIYPNPASDIINITSENTIEKAEISDLTGKTVLTSSNLTNNTIDISSLAKGVYVLKLVSGDVVGTTKIIKE